MIEKNKLKNYAGKLMFDMKDEEYETLSKEFETIIRLMDLIGEIEGINEVEPMTFPFELNPVLRDDTTSRAITVEEALKNSDSVKGREIRVPKVVE